MAKKLGWNSSYSNDNLLARLLRLFYVIPPVVNETPGVRQRNLMMRFNLPVSRAQRFSGRARELCENKEPAPVVEPSASENAEGIFASDSDNVVMDAESDPARSSRLGSGPGTKKSAGSARQPASSAGEPAGSASKTIERVCRMHCLSGSAFSCSIIESKDCACCCCDCDCCRKPAREWLLPRAASSYLPLRQPTQWSHKRLQIIRNPEDCVLGALRSGYVLGKSGSVKSRFQKRA